MKTKGRAFQLQPHLNDRKIVRLNVSGTIFETRKSTLSRYPDSLLADESRLKKHWRPELKAFFFDRDPYYFEDILSAYQQHPTTSLQRHENVIEFLEELLYFDMGAVLTEKILNEYKLTFLDYKVRQRPRGTELARRRDALKNYCWNMLENQHYSRSAWVVGAVRRFIMVTSAVAACINSTQLRYCQLTTTAIVCLALQAVCLLYTFVDLVARFASESNIRKFLLSPFNIIDVVTTVVSLTILLTIVLSLPNIATGHPVSIDVTIMKLLFACQTIQLYKFYRYNDFLEALSKMVRNSLMDILALVIIIQLMALSFGQLFVFAERLAGASNLSFADGAWWAMVTISTVGYGDLTTESLFGDLVAVLCILVSRVLLAMLIPVLSNVYKDYVNASHLSSQFRKMMDRHEDTAENASSIIGAGAMFDATSENA